MNGILKVQKFVKTEVAAKYLFEKLGHSTGNEGISMIFFLCELNYFIESIQALNMAQDFCAKYEFRISHTLELEIQRRKGVPIPSIFSSELGN